MPFAAPSASGVRFWSTLSLLGVVWAFASPTPAQSADAGNSVVPVSLAADWLRRDDARCRSGARISAADTLVTIYGDTSLALFWQIPTTGGRPLTVDRTRTWLRECRRPPLDFGNQVRQTLGRGTSLVDASRYRYLSWQWRVTHTLADTGSSRPLDRRYAVRIGINLVKKGTSELREIAYVWARTLPESYAFSHTIPVFPGISHTVHRLVAQSGNDHLDSWVPETRDLLKDYRRIYPGEEPGEIIRIYLRAESERPDVSVVASFTDVRFHTHLP